MTALVPISITIDPAVAAAAVVQALNPSGTLLQAVGNPELDAELDRFDSIDAAVQKHLANTGLVARLEDDFAACVPMLADGISYSEAFWIPMLASLTGPAAAPFVSLGLTIAMKILLAALTSWAAKRRGAAK